MIQIEDGAKRVRAYLGGELVADTIRPKLVWEIPHYPAYYLPLDDVRTELVPPGAGRQVPDLPDHLCIDWSAMDHWFEEDEEVIVHPRDPHKRVDILRSSRHVQVELDGVTVADSRRPTLLFETGLPTRYYLPLTDVRMDLLRPSDTTTQCPYKGTATYWSLGEHKDLVWTYRSPLPESQKIIGLACFYNERVDLIVDGARLSRR